MIRNILFLIALLGIPHIAFAEVYISEVAWMGDSESANNEWIELFSTESVSLEGWSLSALDGTPSIALSGTISGAFLLERGEGVLASVADIVYVGALENGGEVLVLSDAQGNEIDRVDGSSSWSDIGGDNDSKETAQKVSGVWKTDVATPGKIESTAPAVVEESSSSGSSATSSYVRPVLTISVPDTMSVVAGSDTAFSVEVGNSEGATYSGALVSWNFGDGSTASGSNIYHRYVYPGVYVANVEVSYGGESASKRVVVTAREAGVSFSYIDEYAVEIKNTDTAELDISRWRIIDGNNMFVFPEGTVVLGENGLMLSHTVAGFLFSKSSSLSYPNGELVEEVEELQVEQVSYVPVYVEKEEVAEEVVEVKESSLPAAVIEAGEKGDISIWIYAWIVLVLAVGGSIVYIRKYG